MKESNHNLIYITHKAELLIWLLVLLFLISFATITFIFKEKNDTNDYNIFMPDVDGLIVGSPVRAMGIEIGHVVKIKPTNEEVFVKFIITDKDIVIPQGTKATVEFSGMAGSKSLELYLPDSNTYIDNSTPLLDVNPPKRLHDAIGLLNDMYKKLGSIIYTSSWFGEQVQRIDMPQASDKEKNLKDFLEYSDKVLDDSNKRAENLEKKLNETRRKK